MNRWAPLLAALGVVGALAGCGGSGGKTVKVTAQTVPIKVVDLGAKGVTPGDMYVFDSDVVDADGGKKVGHVYGMQTAITVKKDREIVQANITYRFDDGSSLTIGGLGEYPLGDIGLFKNKPFERPIVGGTGTYAGATGTDTTVRLADGRYQHTFHIQG